MPLQKRRQLASSRPLPFVLLKGNGYPVGSSRKRALFSTSSFSEGRPGHLSSGATGTTTGEEAPSDTTTRRGGGSDGGKCDGTGLIFSLKNKIGYYRVCLKKEWRKKKKTSSMIGSLMTRKGHE